jgi:hypothetical protein
MDITTTKDLYPLYFEMLAAKILTGSSIPFHVGKYQYFYESKKDFEFQSLHIRASVGDDMWTETNNKRYQERIGGDLEIGGDQLWLTTGNWPDYNRSITIHEGAHAT